MANKKIFTDESLETFVDEIKNYVDDAVSKKANTSHTHSISNVTNLQTTLDGKQATVTGGASTITSSNLTANRALISNGSGKVAVSAITSTELGYLDGVTSNVQTQLDGKAPSSHNHSASNITSGTLSSDRLPTVPIAKGGTGATTAADALTNLGITATATELNYIDGVTSNVQTQLNGKAASGHTHNYAGSSSAGGAATSANKLNTDAGSATQPVYFSGGIPKATTYTLGKSVPSNAVFTDTTYSAATTSANGLMSSTDKKRVDAFAGSYSLGNMANKTIANFQTALDTWLNSYANIPNASATFTASTDWVTGWNSGNTASTISAGGQWVVTIIASYSTKSYTQLRFAYYSDEQVVYAHRSNGTWGTAHKAAFKDDLTSKQDTITGGASTITSSNLTANRALVSNGSGKVAVSAVTSTELGYLDGVTSAIQTQLNGKAASSHTHNTTYVPDTRDNNQTPAWYITNYPKQVITEFKTTTAIGLTGTNYCKLTTYVQWANSSGGYPSQETIINGKIHTRYGTSDNTWSDWKVNVDNGDVATLAEVKTYLGI